MDPKKSDHTPFNAGILLKKAIVFHRMRHDDEYRATKHLREEPYYIAQRLKKAGYPHDIGWADVAEWCTYKKMFPLETLQYFREILEMEPIDYAPLVVLSGALKDAAWVLETPATEKHLVVKGVQALFTEGYAQRRESGNPDNHLRLEVAEALANLTFTSDPALNLLKEEGEAFLLYKAQEALAAAGKSKGANPSRVPLNTHIDPECLKRLGGLLEKARMKCQAMPKPALARRLNKHVSNIDAERITQWESGQAVIPMAAFRAIKEELEVAQKAYDEMFVLRFPALDPDGKWLASQPPHLQASLLFNSYRDSRDITLDAIEQHWLADKKALARFRKGESSLRPHWRNYLIKALALDDKEQESFHEKCNLSDAAFVELKEKRHNGNGSAEKHNGTPFTATDSVEAGAILPPGNARNAGMALPDAGARQRH